MSQVWENMTTHERNKLVVSILGGYPDGLTLNEILERFEYYEVMKYPPGHLIFASVFFEGTWFRREGKTAKDAICKAALQAHRVTV